MATKSSLTQSSENTYLRQLAYAVSILFIFILPWRALFTLTEGITAARVVGALAGLFWVTYLIQYGKMRRPDPFHLVLFLLVVWTGLSTLWSINLTATLLTFFSLFSGAMFCFVLWDLIRTEDDLAIAALAYVAGCFVLMFIEGFDFLFLESLRIGDFISGSNYVVARLIFGLPMAWYLVVCRAPHGLEVTRYIGVLYLPLASVAILFTRSRQGFITLAAALLLIILVHSYSRGQIQLSIGAAIVGVLSTALIANYAPSDRFQEAIPIERLERVFGVLTGNVSLEVAELDGRSEIYAAAIEIFRSNFLLGTGAGTFPTASELVMESSNTPHSTYFAISTETGIIGLFLFLLMIWILLRGLLNFNSSRQMMGMILISLYLSIALVNTWFTDFTALFVMTIILLSSTHNLDSSNKDDISGD